MPYLRLFCLAGVKLCTKEKLRFHFWDFNAFSFFFLQMRDTIGLLSKDKSGLKKTCFDILLDQIG